MEIRPKNVSPVARALAGASGKAHHFLTSGAGLCVSPHNYYLARKPKWVAYHEAEGPGEFLSITLTHAIFAGVVLILKDSDMV
jgi:hypothetical protein